MDRLDLRTPSSDDLHALKKLCGSDDLVVVHLARCYGVPVETIAPTVLRWLKDLPPVQPPSRQRSAPSVMAPAVMESALRRVVASARPPEVMPVRTPPASAPVKGDSAALVAAMRRLDTRLNNNTQATFGHGKAAAAEMKQPQRATFHHGLGLLPVPEELIVYDNAAEERKHNLVRNGNLTNGQGADAPKDDAAFAAYMERQAIVYGRGKLAPAGPTNIGFTGRKEILRADWMTRK